MAEYSSEHIHTSRDHSAGTTEGNKRKQQPQQPRQLLSCTKCRGRKVKCDRTKPCSACCARGSPRDCHFIAEDGNYAPIQQSYELRKLRAENVRLKERLRASNIPIEDEESDQAASPDDQVGDRPSSSKRRAAKQKRFQGSEWQDSIYFGSPGLATVISDFASTNIDPSVTLSHATPRALDIYAPRNPSTYAFPTIFSAAAGALPLLDCLPEREELLEYLSAFEGLVNICSFPYVPMEISRSEVARFLADPEKNAQMCPDFLALLFAAIALGTQHSIWDKGGGRWDVDLMDMETQKGNVYIAAAMQALRLASFMHKPSLLGIIALLMIAPYLTNSGRFLEAFTLFGITVRSAHSIGLHRHPKYLDPAPISTRERSIIWWWMLNLDQQYSITLGRPLGISGIGDCPWPHELTTDPTMLRFGEFVNHFTVLSRQILSSDRLTNLRIDDFTDALRGLLETVPETLQFDDSWTQPENTTPEHGAMAAVYYCRIHTYLVLLNRQRIEKPTTPSALPVTRGSTPSFRAVNRAPPTLSSTATTTKASFRGRALVIASSEDILDAFVFFYHKQQAALIDWTIGQQAFNSCMLILLNAIECRTITTAALKAERAFVVFKELDDNNVHKLAGLAIEKISWALQELHKIVTQPPGAEHQARGQQGRHAVMQEAAQNEATRDSGTMDTVMGGTGMLLLEDPGLQSVHETFASITWGTPRISAESTGEQLLHRHRTGQIAVPKSELSNEDMHSFRPADVMQGLRRSTTLRSAPTRYATPSDDDRMQPHGYTAPTSPTGFSLPQQQQLGTSTRDQHEWQTAHTYGRVSPLHLQTQVHGSAGHREWEYEGRTGGDQRLGNPTYASMGPRHVSHISQRHNSCPSLPHSAPQQPLLRPTYSSPSNVDRPTAAHMLPLNASLSAARGTEQTFVHIPQHLGNPNVHAPFTARPVPMSSIAEVVPGFSQTAHGFQGQQVHQQQGQMGYPFPMHPSSGMASSTLTPLTESMDLEEWRKYVGGQGTG